MVDQGATTARTASKPPRRQSIAERPAWNDRLHQEEQDDARFKKCVRACVLAEMCVEMRADKRSDMRACNKALGESGRTRAIDVDKSLC